MSGNASAHRAGAGEEGYRPSRDRQGVRFGQAKNTRSLTVAAPPRRLQPQALQDLQLVAVGPNVAEDVLDPPVRADDECRPRDAH